MNSFKKENFLSKNKILNGWIHIDSTLTAKIMASKKFNSITIDLQHGMLSFDKCKDVIQILSNYNIFPIVRVPSNEIGIINKVLDAGAYGIICPLINTNDECKRFLNACYYPPLGIRSFGPTVVASDNKNYFFESNSNILSIIMIETKESVINLSDILLNKNLDMLYIGPYDLSINFGFSPEDVYENKKMLDTYNEILNKAKEKNKKVAIHCSGAEIGNFFLNMGFDMVTISTDLNILSKGILKELESL